MSEPGTFDSCIGLFIFLKLTNYSIFLLRDVILSFQFLSLGENSGFYTAKNVHT